MEGSRPGALESDDGSREALPPRLLLPRGADDLGSFTSIQSAITGALGPVMEVARYRILNDGAFLYRSLERGRAGMAYSYRSIDDDRDPVAVIGVGLPRDGWQPDRSKLPLGSSPG
jgi:hypothetical protein